MQLVFFRLYLVLHACAARFDVMGTTQNLLESKHALILCRQGCLQTEVTEYHLVKCPIEQYSAGSLTSFSAKSNHQSQPL